MRPDFYHAGDETVEDGVVRVHAHVQRFLGAFLGRVLVVLDHGVPQFR